MTARKEDWRALKAKKSPTLMLWTPFSLSHPLRLHSSRGKATAVFAFSLSLLFASSFQEGENYRGTHSSPLCVQEIEAFSTGVTSVQ